jgi:hypothetical protein
MKSDELKSIGSDNSYPLKVCIISIWLVLILAPFAMSKEDVRTIHVFVALCDNVNQGIVPVPEALGNGEDPVKNLYWGARYGIKTFFKNSGNWDLLSSSPGPGDYILERCVFKHRDGDFYLVADAYKGRFIKQTVIKFLESASGRPKKTVSFRKGRKDINLSINGSSDMVVYIGHNGLMDFKLETYPEKSGYASMDAIILACRSKPFFKKAIEKSGAMPVLWCNGLMAPEAYTLESALEGWIKNESGGSIQLRAARAYNRYQKCGLNAAKRLFSSGK